MKQMLDLLHTLLFECPYPLIHQVINHPGDLTILVPQPFMDLLPQAFNEQLPSNYPPMTQSPEVIHFHGVQIKVGYEMALILYHPQCTLDTNLLHKIELPT